ncbi:oligosaccharide flippase family protein [Candidatus Woesearchaeota archaeon]|nr:oligosaccharide flippase family protein [Candidatus Woesearchaeota archaeon]
MIKKSLIMGFTSGTLMLIGLVIQYFLAKYLSIDEYGMYILMFSWISVLSVFSLNSFNTTVIKASAQSYPRFFKTATKICFLFSLLGSIILLIVGFFFETQNMNLFILIAIFFPFYGGINLAESYLIGSSKFNKYSVYVIVSQIIVAVIQILSVVFLQGIFWLLFFTLLGTSIINIIMTFSIYTIIRQRKNVRKEKKLVKYGIGLTWPSIFSSIASRIQYILLAALADTSILAIYAVAQLIPEKIKGLIKSSINPLSIYLASKTKKESIYLMQRLILPLLMLGVLGYLMILIILPIGIKLVFGQKYQEAIFYSLVLSLPVIVIPLDALFISIVIYHGYKEYYTKLTLLTNIIQIVLFIILIPYFKIWGVIFSIVGLVVIVTFVNLIWFYRLPKYNVEKTILTMQRDLNIKGYKTLYFDGKFTGENILKVISADSINEEHHPYWVRISRIILLRGN